MDIESEINERKKETMTQKKIFIIVLKYFFLT